MVSVPTPSVSCRSLPLLVSRGGQHASHPPLCLLVLQKWRVIGAPVDIAACIGRNAVTMAASGFNHVACVTSTGNVVGWGMEFNRGSFGPIRVIGGGYGYVMCVCEDGSVVAWGSNDSGQLGLGSKSATATSQAALVDLRNVKGRVVGIAT